jgi:4-amino-4-deoxy-L-arabinose transferase-like glycosyltransferase
MSPLLKLRLAQITLIALFLGLGLALSLAAPFTTGPDEVAHFSLTRFVAKHGRLPITREERSEAGYKSDWPPLFHGLAGLAGRGIDLDSPPFVKIAQNNPRLQLVVGHENIIGWRALTTEDPYRGEVLLWYLARWATLLCGLAGLGATYLLLRTHYADNSWLVLSATAVLAFIPMYIRMSSVISYEPLLGAFLALYFLLLFYTVQNPSPDRYFLGLGLLLGAALLTKFTPLPALPLLLLFVVWLAFRHHWTWRTTIWRLLLVGIGVTLTFGSWVLYMELYFNRVDELGWVAGLLTTFDDQSDESSHRLITLMTQGQLGEITQSRQSATVFQWAWHVFRDMWGGIWLAWPFLGLWGVAIAGLVRQWRHADEATRLWIALLGAHIASFTVLPLLRFLATRDVVTGMGQHILFPAGAALMALLVLGLSAWLTRPRLISLLSVIAGLSLAWSIVLTQRDAVTAWPIQTVPTADHEVALAVFDDLTLIDYELRPTASMLEATLHWRTEQLLTEDYRIEMTVLDQAGRPQARWLGQPLNGRYPTRAWAPGDRLRDVIHIPVAGLAPGDYQVQLRLLGETGALSPLEINAQTSLPVSVDADRLSLGDVTLTPSSAPNADSITLADQEIGYTLWPPDQPAAKRPIYGERATIVFLLDTLLPDDIRIKLIGPDDQPREPIDQTGYLQSFLVEPYLVNGDYRLRFERWVADEVVAQVETEPLLRIETEERQFAIGPVAQPVMANFAGQVTLLGYDLPQRRVRPGDDLTLTLHWQAQKTIGADLIIFNHLIDAQQTVWGGKDRRTRDIYSTMLWAPREIVTDPFHVEVAPDAPDGIYRLLVGLYLPVGEAPVSLPLVQDGQLTDVTSVTVGPIKVGSTPSELTIESANPQFTLNQPFGETSDLILLGYDLTDQADHPIDPATDLTGSALPQALNLTVYWRSEILVAVDYTTFVHVRNGAGDIIAQQDQPPLNGAYPTSLWDPGELIADTITIPVPPDFAVGSYDLVVGLYDFATGARLVVPDNATNEVLLATFQVGLGESK